MSISARMGPASFAPVSVAAEGEEVVRVAVAEVHELVGQLVVVLHRVHEGRRVDADARAQAQVSRRNSVSPVSSAWW